MALRWRTRLGQNGDMRNLKNFITSLCLATLFAAPVAAQEVHVLWSDTHNEVLAEHNAAVYQPVSRTLNGTDWKFQRAEAQRALRKVYPRDRDVVREVKVVGEKDDAQTPEEYSYLRRRLR